MSADVCPFCECDPFHYVDNGVGMEAVAVTCCELGDEYFRGARDTPEVVTLSWEDFSDIGRRLAKMQGMREALEEIDALEVMEINPSNYDHELVCELSSNASQAASIARDAIAKAEGLDAGRGTGASESEPVK